MAHLDEAWNNKIFPNALESAAAAPAEIERNVLITLRDAPLGFNFMSSSVENCMQLCLAITVQRISNISSHPFLQIPQSLNRLHVLILCLIRIKDCTLQLSLSIH
jgi:hypothetical protein